MPWFVPDHDERTNSWRPVESTDAYSGATEKFGKLRRTSLYIWRIWSIPVSLLPSNRPLYTTAFWAKRLQRTTNEYDM